MIKNSQRNRKREEFSQFDKEHLKKKKKTKKTHNYTTNIIFNGKRLNDFLQKLGTTQSSAFTTLIQHRA